MRSTFSGLNAVMRGMAVQQVGLDTVGHNIANASTVGYSRQVVTTSTTRPELIYGTNGPMYIGTGVTVESITRARDTFIDHQLWKELASLGYGEMAQDTLSKIEGVFSEPKETGIQSVLNYFWEAWQMLGVNASDNGARITVRQRGVELVDAIQHAREQLRDMIYDINTVVEIKVNNINQICAEISSLNNQIAHVEFVGAQANDLRDRRDALVDELAKLTKVSVYEDKQGNYIIQTAGVTIVDSLGYVKLACVDDLTGELNTQYGYISKMVVVEGMTQPLNITSGELGGLLKARDVDIEGYLDKLATISKFLLTEFNAVHEAGYGLDDSTGIRFFGQQDDDFSTFTRMGDWLNALAVNKLLFEPESGLLKIAARSSLDQGGASGDNAIALANRLKLDQSDMLGKASLDTYYTTIIGQLGVDTQNAKRLTENQNTLVNQIKNWRESVSGVNLDEEMVNMIRFQQGYNAAARMVTTIDEMLDKLINGTGVVGR